MTEQEYTEILVLIQKMRNIAIAVYVKIGDTNTLTELDGILPADIEHWPYVQERAPRDIQTLIVSLNEKYLKKLYIYHVKKEPTEPQSVGAWNLITAINALDLIVIGLLEDKHLINLNYHLDTNLPQYASMDQIIQKLKELCFNMEMLKGFRPNRLNTQNNNGRDDIYR
ncbi:MAG: hypothetical protein IJQ95_03055 [Paludibacteraceae bacterium]|nr:hypothetical protein [Paludibacteraceae bacterium]